MQIVERTPENFIASLPDDDVRRTMLRLDEIITGALPQRRRVLWEGVFWGGTDQSIVGYGDIRQPRPKGKEVEWFLVGLARQKNNYSIYLNAVEDGKYLAHQFGDRLGKVKLGAASIGFKRLEQIDLDVLSELLVKADTLTPPDPVPPDPGGLAE